MSAARRTLAAVLGCAALAHGALALHAWTSGSTAPFAHHPLAERPAWLLGLIAALLGLAAVRRVGLELAAGGALAWALAVHAVADLPTYAANHWYGDGPGLFPAYLAVGAALGLYVVAGPRSVPPHERLLHLALVATASNGRLFSRESDSVYALVAACALLALAAAPAPPPAVARADGTAERRDRVVAALAACGAALVAWIGLGAALGDNLGAGYRVWLRVLTGGVLALAVARALDRQSAERAVAALAWSIAACLAVLVAGLAEAAAVEPLERVWRTRLRLFDMHANGIGPLFAIGAALGAGLATGRGLGARVGGAALALACALAVARTQSQASQAGAVVGVVVVLAARFAPVPRRGAWLHAPLAGALALGAAVWLSPLADGVRARLDALTSGPSALGQRWHFWRMAGDAIASSPVVGVGPNQYHLHARFAEPSYYDGTSQSLHTHDLPLAIAEGAGIPALLLFVAATWLALELLRRALAARGPERAGAAAIGGATAALLAANLLDLGQSQQTFLPLVWWVALGWLVARGREPAEERPAPPPRLAWASLALALPLALYPLTADTALRTAEARLARGDAEGGLRAARVALRLDPAEPRAVNAAIEGARLLRLGAQGLELLAHRTRQAPGRGQSWYTLGREQLVHGLAEQAARSLARARELDPRGEQIGDLAFADAWLASLAGDAERFRELAVDGLLLGGSLWRRMPTVELERPADWPAGARRLAWPVLGDRSAPPLPIDEALDGVGAAAVAIGADDPVRSRRAMQVVQDLAEHLGHPALALEWFAAQAAATPERMPGLVYLELQARAELGQDEVVRAMVDVGGAGGTYLREAWFRAVENARGLEGLVQVSTDLEATVDAIDRRDCFFEAGYFAWILEAAARVRLAQGDTGGALSALERALREHPDTLARGDLAQAHWQALLDADPPDAALVPALRVLLAELSLDPRRASGTEALRARARRALQAWDGDPEDFASLARAALAGRGPAEDAFLAELAAELGG